MLGADVGLTPNNVLKIMAETDDNDNGVIEYKEFLPVAMETIQVRLEGLNRWATLSHSECKLKQPRCPLRYTLHRMM